MSEKDADTLQWGYDCKKYLFNQGAKIQLLKISRRKPKGFYKFFRLNAEKPSDNADMISAQVRMICIIY